MSGLITAIIASAVIGAGTAAVSANQQRQAAKGAAGERQRAADKLEKDTERNREQADMKLRKRGAASELKPRDTVLTSPLGLPSGGTQTGGKTLLGL